MSRYFIALMFIVTLGCSAVKAEGYLFATFTGEHSPMGEQIYFAASDDGLEWEMLNDGEPVLISDMGKKGVRDPFLIRSHDGETCYLIATDLSVHLLNHDWGKAVTAGSHNIVIWESTDMVNWSEPRLVEVAPEDAGCTWAPEAIYDEETGEYMVFWASTTERDNFAKHRIWARRTPDFREFSEPFVFIEKENHVIDTDIVREDGHYYRFTKDESTKATLMEHSASLMGDWQTVESFSLDDLIGYEGPQCFPLKEEGKWCLILDRYSKGTGYEGFVTDDLSSGHFEKIELGFPMLFRHGSVLPLRSGELDALRKHFGN